MSETVKVKGQSCPPKMENKMTSKKILAKIAAFPCRFEDELSNKYVGEIASKFNLDAHDAKQLGLTTATAQYVGGTKKSGKFVTIVVLSVI